ncbi:P-II family nitrogen regulator [Almyronema epifaneia]|uniref:P-II family nitrogen regulator n=1 Tax=Almyronema epifaneia S1 TaxID=2991925 RepID=A0ABW6IG88_9CYAN
MSVQTKKAVLVTIIGESVLQDRLRQLMKTLGVSGYTFTLAQGVGSHGVRVSDVSDIAGYKTNLELKTVVSEEVSDQILTEIKTYQAKYALIAFRQPVEALLD